jgi:hypothetical protein
LSCFSVYLRCVLTRAHPTRPASSALNAAVPKRIPFNPAAGQRFPETVKQDMVALTPEEFAFC